MRCGMESDRDRMSGFSRWVSAKGEIRSSKLAQLAIPRKLESLPSGTVPSQG